MRAAPLTVLLLLVSGTASANPGINGYSGKPYNGVASTCDTTCHKSNPPLPTITLTIPTTVQAGSKNDVTLVVAGTRVRTSFDAAFSDGVVVTAGSNTVVPFPMQNPDEVVAATPPPSGAKGTYKFSFTAPKTNGTITLWVAAMSASGSGTGGDGVAKTTRTITVTGGTTPSSDGGTASSTSSSSSSSGGVASDAGHSSSPDGGDESASSSGSNATNRRLSNSSSDGGGCRLGPAQVSTSEDGSWLAIALAITAAARGRARRRSPARAVAR